MRGLRWRFRRGRRAIEGIDDVRGLENTRGFEDSRVHLIFPCLFEEADF